jgi:NTP pyrophosphatase (non-canonical NTP hydrolase)
MDTLKELREANIARQKEWRGAEKVDLAFRGLEMAGEAGELANKLKKLVRLQRGITGTQEEREALLDDIADEMGDVLVCLDLIAEDLGIDLGLATRIKFNKTSAKQGLNTRMF